VHTRTSDPLTGMACVFITEIRYEETIKELGLGLVASQTHQTKPSQWQTRCDSDSGLKREGIHGSS